MSTLQAQALRTVEQHLSSLTRVRKLDQAVPEQVTFAFGRDKRVTVTPNNVILWEEDETDLPPVIKSWSLGEYLDAQEGRA